MGEEFRIKTFGGFSISYGDCTVSDQDNRSKKIWNLIEYITVFHNKSIEQSTLLDLMWNEDSSISASPENALKTSLHRARQLLDGLGVPGDTKIIIHKRGSFSWNPLLPIRTDFEEFDKLCETAADQSLSHEERKKAYFSAFTLYRGDFLPKVAEDSWVMPISAYYHALYLKMFHEFMELLMEEEAYNEMIDYCHTAASIDSYDEDIHYYMILSLFRSGKQNRALSQYEQVINLYYNNFGINPSQKLYDLYKDIIKLEKQYEANLNVIRDDLKEENASRRAYFCEYHVFKQFYQIEARITARSGLSVYLCLITLQEAAGSSSTDWVAKGMNRMKSIIEESLRAGDVFTRYSKNQYLLMLPSACYENSIMIGERILRNFDNSKPKINVRLSFSVKHLETQDFADELDGQNAD